MSWSISFIGKPENVAEALQQYSEKLIGESKVEYDDALPHIKALVEQNYGSNSALLKVDANGHGCPTGDNPYNNCQVTIALIYGVLV